MSDGKGHGASKKSGGEYGALAAGGTRSLHLRLALVWLTTALAFATLFACRLAWDPSATFATLLPFWVFTAAVIAEAVALSGRTLYTDARLFETATFLAGLGIAMQYRMGAFDGGASGIQFAVPAAFAMLIGVFLAFRSGRWRILEKLAPACYILALASMAALLVFGRKYRGGYYLPGNLNPTEIAKPLLAIALAAFLAKNRKALSRSFLGIPIPGVRALLLLAAIWLPPMALAMLLHDLGLALLLCLMLVVMLAASTRRPGWLVIGAACVVVAGFALWRVPGHVHTRIAAWLDPFVDPNGGGWQLIQGFSAFFAGGIWGSGLGAGLPVEIPIVATDFIYAAIAEELGMALCLLILALMASLSVRGFLAAGRPESDFGQALAAGLAAIPALQAILNIGGIVKALPMTGIVLPFLSQGGSGLLTMMATVALLAAVESERAR